MVHCEMKMSNKVKTRGNSSVSADNLINNQQGNRNAGFIQVHSEMRHIQFHFPSSSIPKSFIRDNGDLKYPSTSNFLGESSRYLENCSLASSFLSSKLASSNLSSTFSPSPLLSISNAFSNKASNESGLPDKTSSKTALDSWTFPILWYSLAIMNFHSVFSGRAAANFGESSFSSNSSTTSCCSSSTTAGACASALASGIDWNFPNVTAAKTAAIPADLRVAISGF
nr:hypothetical protein glysoja_025703 [Ipomoea batatas]